MADNQKPKTIESNNAHLNESQTIPLFDKEIEKIIDETDGTADDLKNTNSIDNMKEETKLVIVVIALGLLLSLLTVVLLLSADVRDNSIADTVTAVVSDATVS